VEDRADLRVLGLLHEPHLAQRRHRVAHPSLDGRRRLRRRRRRVRLRRAARLLADAEDLLLLVLGRAGRRGGREARDAQFVLGEVLDDVDKLLVVEQLVVDLDHLVAHLELRRERGLDLDHHVHRVDAEAEL
jgi:hypothetical protein